MARLGATEIYNFLSKPFPDEFPALVEVPKAMKNPYEKQVPKPPSMTIRRSKTFTADTQFSSLAKELQEIHRSDMKITCEREIIGHRFVYWDYDAEDYLECDEHHYGAHSEACYGEIISFTASWSENNPNYKYEYRQYEGEIKNLENLKSNYNIRKSLIQEAIQENRERIKNAIRLNPERWKCAAQHLLGKNPGFLSSRKEQLLKELAVIESAEQSSESEV